MNTGAGNAVRRRTKERELVLKAVRALSHPSAREIFAEVSRERPVSFGTVYRNLMILCQDGEIACVDQDADGSRYDSRRERHHHFKCKKCGKVFDVPIPYRSAVDRAGAQKSGFAIEGHTLTFTGLCKTCASAASQGCDSAI